MDNKFFKEILKGYENGCELTDEVVNIILSYGDSQPIEFIDECLNQGIENLLTNSVVTDLFEEYCDEIFERYNYHKFKYRDYPYIGEVNKISLVCFAIEDIMRELVDKLGIDLDRRDNDKFVNYCECVEILMHLDDNSDFDLILKDNDYYLNPSYNELTDSVIRVIEDFEEMGEIEEIIKPYREILEKLL